MGETKKKGERSLPQRILEGRTVVGVDHADEPDALVLMLDDGNKISVGAVQHVEVRARTLKDELNDLKTTSRKLDWLASLLHAKELARTPLTAVNAQAIAEAFGMDGTWSGSAYGDELVLLTVKS